MSRYHYTKPNAVVIPPRNNAADVLLRGPQVVAAYMIKHGRNLWPSVRVMPTNVRQAVVARDPKCSLAQAILSIQ